MADPEVPEPDGKDWTWTLERPCPECGYDASALEPADVAAITRACGESMIVVLGRPEARTRPQPTVWSPLEYACHVRDVCVLFERRLGLMMNEHDPIFRNWDQDETALAARYWEAEPRVVADELRASSSSVAAAFAAVVGPEWQRPGRRSNGSLFTVDTFARYFLHDLVHHVWDVTGRA